MQLEQPQKPKNQDVGGPSPCAAQTYGIHVLGTIVPSHLHPEHGYPKPLPPVLSLEELSHPFGKVAALPLVTGFELARQARGVLHGVLSVRGGQLVHAP
jgi:hypothetical protein